MNEPRPVARDVGLVAVVFVGTLILLAGLALGLGGRSAGSSPRSDASIPGLSSPVAGRTVPPSPPSPPRVSSAPASTDPVLVGAGDIADCSSPGDEATAALVDGIPGTVFTAGDNAYPDGTVANFADCYEPTWGRFRLRTRPAAGNHDWVTKDAAGYLGYFGSSATNADGRTWYSYELGEWHVIVLDSNCDKVEGCGPESAQGKWLDADLAASRAVCTVAIWHHPRFSSGDEHGNDPVVAPFWDAMYSAGVDVVINGHDHDYERFGPQTPAGVPDPDRGIREFVVGTGGAELRGFKESQPNSDIRYALSPGVLKLTLHPRGYDWAFVPTSTIFSDSGSATCH